MRKWLMKIIDNNVLLMLLLGGVHMVSKGELKVRSLNQVKFAMYNDQVQCMIGIEGNQN